MLKQMFKRITRRVALEARAFPDRVKDRLLGCLPDEFKYRRGMITLDASIRNLRRNGFEPGSIIDIGAYHGEWSRMARRHFPGAQIYMFEANPEQEPILSSVVKEIGAAEYRIALLGSKPADSVRFFVKGTGSSVLEENTSLPGSVAQFPMATLDSVLIGKALPGPYFLKLDVQGFELEVLRGAQQILQETEAALLEVSLLEYNKGAPMFAEVVAFMDAQGFAVYDISGFYRRESDDALYMVDLLFVRANSALRSKKHFWNLEARFEARTAGSSRQ
jgi:FkbM family methyltransferase